jgi:hypothetical protein
MKVSWLCNAFKDELSVLQTFDLASELVAICHDNDIILALSQQRVGI